MRYMPTLVRHLCEGVYPPGDDSRLLVESIEAVQGMRVLDIGTGSGIVALHCASAGAEVVATDISKEAVRCARLNALVGALRIKVVRTSLLSGIKGRFDLITFNPPYLPSTGRRDEHAIDGGTTGGEVLRRFLSGYRGYLAPGGRAAVVVSSQTGMHGITGYKVLSERRIFFETLRVLEFR